MRSIKTLKRCTILNHSFTMLLVHWIKEAYMYIIIQRNKSTILNLYFLKIKYEHSFNQQKPLQINNNKTKYVAYQICSALCACALNLKQTHTHHPKNHTLYTILTAFYISKSHRFNLLFSDTSALSHISRSTHQSTQ